ncbi:unnamed protein product [Calypogeia fissa]
MSVDLETPPRSRLDEGWQAGPVEGKQWCGWYGAWRDCWGECVSGWLRKGVEENQEWLKAGEVVEKSMKKEKREETADQVVDNMEGEHPVPVVRGTERKRLPPIPAS